MKTEIRYMIYTVVLAAALIHISGYAGLAVKAEEKSRIDAQKIFARGDLSSFIQAKTPGEINIQQFYKMQSALVNAATQCMKAESQKKKKNAVCVSLWRAIHF